MSTGRIATGLLAAALVLAGCSGDGGGKCGDGLCESPELGKCSPDCEGDFDAGDVTCTADGVEYEVGVTFPAGDGCNTCTCQADGHAGCTEIACEGSDGCRTNDDCGDLPGSYCAPPGSSPGCGIGCGLQMCSSHDGCTTEGQVCHRAHFEPYRTCCPDPVPGAGYCGARCDAETGGVSCGEGNRCADDGACEPIPCDEGYECADGARCNPDAATAGVHGCEPIPCDDGYECAIHMTCDPSSTTGHGCTRDRCERDGDCGGSGYCVGGSCYSSLGVCLQPAP